MKECCKEHLSGNEKEHKPKKTYAWLIILIVVVVGCAIMNNR